MLKGRQIQNCSVPCLAGYLILFLASMVNGKTEGGSIVACGGVPADVVFILDCSNSIWNPYFRKQLQFVKDVVHWFTLGSEVTGSEVMRVAVVTYADRPYLQFSLTQYSTKSEINAAIDDVRQIGGYHTKTADVIDYVANTVLDNPSIRRPGIARVAILLSDGLSDNATATERAAALAKQSGIHWFAIGIGRDADLQELKSIASQPSEEYLFLVDDFSSLTNIKNLLAIKTCQVTDPPTTTSTTTSPTPPVDADKDSKTSHNKSNGGRSNGTYGTQTPSTTVAFSRRTPLIITPPPYEIGVIDSDRELAEQRGLSGTLHLSSNTTAGSTLNTTLGSTLNAADWVGDKSLQVLVDGRLLNLSGENLMRFLARYGYDMRKIGGGELDRGDGSGLRGRWVYDEITSRFWFIHRTPDNEKYIDNTDNMDRNIDDTEFNSHISDIKENKNKEDADNKEADGNYSRSLIDDVFNKEEKKGSNMNTASVGAWWVDGRGVLVWLKYISPGKYQTSNGTAIEVIPESDSDTQGVMGIDWPVNRNISLNNSTDRNLSRFSMEDFENSDGSAVHVYLSERPEAGGSGYWRYEKREGFVWYRYVDGGRFERDLNATRAYRLAHSQRDNREAAMESNDNSRRSRHISKGYWRPDADGRMVWHSYGESKNSSKDNSTNNDTRNSRETHYREANSLGYWGYDSYGRRIWRNHKPENYFLNDSTLVENMTQPEQNERLTNQRGPNRQENSQNLILSESESEVVKPGNNIVVNSTNTGSAGSINTDTIAYIENSDTNNTIPILRFATKPPQGKNDSNEGWDYDEKSNIWITLDPPSQNQITKRPSKSSAALHGRERSLVVRPGIDGKNRSQNDRGINGRSGRKNGNEGISAIYQSNSNGIEGKSGRKDDSKGKGKAKETLWGYNEHRRRLWYKPDTAGEVPNVEEDVQVTINTTHPNSLLDLLLARNLSSIHDDIELPQAIRQLIESGQAVRLNNSGGFERNWVVDDKGKLVQIYQYYNKTEGNVTVSSLQQLFGLTGGSAAPHHNDLESKPFERFGSEKWHQSIQQSSGELEERFRAQGSRDHEALPQEGREVINRPLPGSNNNTSSRDRSKARRGERKGRTNKAQGCALKDTVSLLLIVDQTTNNSHQLWNVASRLSQSFQLYDRTIEIFPAIPNWFKERIFQKSSRVREIQQTGSVAQLFDKIGLDQSGETQTRPSHRALTSDLSNSAQKHRGRLSKGEASQALAGFSDISRTSSKAVVIYLTNGLSTDFRETRKAARKLRNNNRVVVFGVGVGPNVKVKQLAGMVSRPQNKHNKLIAVDSDIDRTVVKLTKKICRIL